ncbi:MAG: D-glycero-beta-D-manno-heptose 1-phosphate adenylyltransferase [Bdellovibrionaceae bacterium]|nr:D-glycero-beta-D-manno-heptose 1-phosphate adenylyltransferase [Pseudobdellovibrionaceae bacterium]
MGRVFQKWDDLVAYLRQTRGGRRVVFTNGCFDILHVGHIRYLQEAKALGDLLVVGLNTDASVKKLKGSNRPVQDENSRAEIMAALGCVDAVTLFGEETPKELIEKVKPDILVKGGDYKISEIVGADFVQSYGGQVKALQFVPGFSTSSILKRV